MTQNNVTVYATNITEAMMYAVILKYLDLMLCANRINPNKNPTNIPPRWPAQSTFGLKLKNMVMMTMKIMLVNCCAFCGGLKSFHLQITKLVLQPNIPIMAPDAPTLIE